MLKKRFKKLLITGILFFIGWAILYVIFAVAFQKGSGQSTQNFFSSHFGDIAKYLTFANLSTTKEVMVTVSCYVIILVAVLLALIWINYAAKSKNLSKLLGFLIVWLLMFPLLEMVAAFYPYTGASDHVYYTSYLGFITNPGMGILAKIFIFILLAFALVSSILGIILCLTGIVGFAKQSNRTEEEALISEERETLESIVAEREREEARLEEVRAAREREESEHVVREGLTNDDLLELIRRVVREELDKRDNSSPKIIQNFYGLSSNPQPEPTQIEPQNEEPAQVINEVKAEEPVIEEPVEDVFDDTPETTNEKKPIIRIPFKTRMIHAEKEMKDNYNELKNELLSYGLKSRISSSGDSFRLHCKTYCKISIAGKSLKLYLALNPNDYKDSTLPIQNAGNKNIYQEIPLVFKVKSGLSMRRAKTLIRDACEKDDLEQGVIGNEDWASRLSLNEDDDIEDSEE